RSSDGTWVQDGAKITGSGAWEFGNFVLISSDASLLVVSTVTLSQIGNVYTMIKSGGTWSQYGSVLNPSGTFNTIGTFGQSCAGNSALTKMCCGGPSYKDNTGDSNTGKMWCYTRSVSTWTEITGSPYRSPGEGGQYGYSLSMTPDGKWLAVGAPTENSGTG